MSTHCGISFKDEEGYHLIYVHSDGYPEYMWPMLTENYNSEELAMKLVSLGDASFIDEKLEPTPFSSHSFNTREPCVSVFYHRDRGEDWYDVKPEIYPHYDRNRFLKSFYYLYVFEEGCWNFYKDGKKVYQ